MTDRNRFTVTFSLGLFLVTLSTIMYELLLTRIFSVTLWYHFAFMAVSLAMFGLTAGAMAVYVVPRLYSTLSTPRLCSLYCLLYSLGIISSFWLQLSVPMTVQFSSGWAVAATYAILSIPFLFSGVVVCLALTRAGDDVARLYAYDLAGAAFGCIVVVFLLELVDAPTAVIWVSQLAALASLVFALDDRRDRGVDAKPSFYLGIVVACVLAISALAISNPSHHFVKLNWSKGDESVRPLLEKWNCFSRVRVYGDPNLSVAPFGWGLSSKLPKEIRVRQLNLDIDSGAGTILTAFNGDLNELRALKFDITNAVHCVCRNADVLIIGAGGGRDILSALAFDQKSILAVEINPNILEAVTRRFGDFTGHLDRQPRVSLLNEEGRCFLSHTKQKFDLIQLSLVDTFAATSAGAFTLSENSLYTREAWDLMFDRLSARGIISATRWYTAHKPGEIYRLTALAVQTLKDAGISDYRKHLAVIRLVRDPSELSSNASGLGTLLLSKPGFSNADLDKLQLFCTEMDFQMVLSEKGVTDPVLARLSSKDFDQAVLESPLLIAAPTDDCPYFFQMVKLKDWANLNLLDSDRMISFYALALLNLGILAILVFLLSATFVAAPLLFSSLRKQALKGIPLCAYFSAIGLAYIFIELSIIQKFQLFFGIPLYSLAVTLFTLLVSSSAGSYLYQMAARERSDISTLIFALLILFCITCGFLGNCIVHSFAGAALGVKIIVSIALLVPLGTIMGMMFPLGMRLADKECPEVKPWLWASNGAMSVFGSVAAVIISISCGISATYLSGIGAYSIAVLCYSYAARKKTL